MQASVMAKALWLHQTHWDCRGRYQHCILAEVSGCSWSVVMPLFWNYAVILVWRLSVIDLSWKKEQQATVYYFLPRSGDVQKRGNLIAQNTLCSKYTQQVTVHAIILTKGKTDLYLRKQTYKATYASVGSTGCQKCSSHGKPVNNLLTMNLYQP